MKKKIWVYVEHHNEKVSPVSLELLSKAAHLAKVFKEGATVSAVVLGDKLDDVCFELTNSSVDMVYAISDSRLKDCSPWYVVPVIASMAEKHQPEIFLFGATASGNVIGPSVAARLKTGMAAHCVNLEINDKEQLVADVPAFGGKVISEILCPDNMPQMASIKPGIFDRDDNENCRTEVLVESYTEILDKIDSSRLQHIKDVEIVPSGISLARADVVVCGGFGVASEEDWKLLKSVANKLGAAIACTRPVVDSGLGSDSQMIGTSGCSVKPKVYLGFGISGATHHICGMNSTGFVINVNKDKDAGVFNYSDVCLVEDAHKVLSFLDQILA